MSTKKNVLLVGAAGSFLVASLVLFDSRTCYIDKYCHVISDFINQENLTLIFVLPFVLFFSLLTYKMKEEVFRAWFQFALWFVPVIMVVTFLLNGAGSGGLGISGAVAGAFNFLVICLFYFVFIFISLIKIVRAHKRLKREEESRPGYQKDSGMTLAEGIAYRWKEWRK